MATRLRTDIFTAEELANLLVEVIHGAAGGSEATWRKVVGRVERVPTWQLVSHNWRVQPTGSAKQRDIADRAVALVRAEHPYIH